MSLSIIEVDSQTTTAVQEDPVQCSESISLSTVQQWTTLVLERYVRFYIGMILAPGKLRENEQSRPIERAAKWWKQRSPITADLQQPQLCAQITDTTTRELKLRQWLDPRGFSYADHLDIRAVIETEPLSHFATFIGRKYTTIKKRRSKKHRAIHTGFVKRRSETARLQRARTDVRALYSILKETLRPFLNRSTVDGNNSVTWTGAQLVESTDSGLDVFARCAVSGSGEALVQCCCELSFKGDSFTATNTDVAPVTWALRRHGNHFGAEKDLAVCTVPLSATSLCSTNENQPTASTTVQEDSSQCLSTTATLKVVLARPWAQILTIVLDIVFHCEGLAAITEQSSFFSATINAGRNTVLCGQRYSRVVDFAKCDFYRRVEIIQQLRDTIDTLRQTQTSASLCGDKKNLQ